MVAAADVFLFLGSDENAKQEKLNALQQRFFPPELKEFNYTVCYGDDKQLSPVYLQEMLLGLPSDGAKKRLCVVRRAHRLNKANRTLLLSALEEGLTRLAIVFDIPEVEDSEDFVAEFSKRGAQLVRFKSETPANIFDLGRAIMAQSPEQALKILSRASVSRERPEKIVGTIFWQWERGFTQKRLVADVYKKGLKMILEADKKLKSSSSAYARQHLILEALVVKLSCLKAARE